MNILTEYLVAADRGMGTSGAWGRYQTETRERLKPFRAECELMIDALLAHEITHDELREWEGERYGRGLH